MINVDTNVLVRAALDDHPEESSIAKQVLRQASKKKELFISSYAILEMIWVLKVKKRTRQEIAEAILNLLDSPGIVIGQRELVAAALELYIKGKADFGDYLISVEGASYSCFKIASFDKTFCKDYSHAVHPNKLVSKQN